MDFRAQLSLQSPPFFPSAAMQHRLTAALDVVTHWLIQRVPSPPREHISGGDFLLQGVTWRTILPSPHTYDAVLNIHESGKNPPKQK